MKRFEIEYLTRETDHRIGTHGKAKLLAEDEAQARRAAVSRIIEDLELDRTGDHVEILHCQELSWQEAYGLPDEIVEFIDRGVLSLLSEDLDKRSVEFLIPAAGTVETATRPDVSYTLKWFHPDNSPTDCDLEGVFFDVRKEIEGCGSTSVDDLDVVDDLLDWLEQIPLMHAAANFASRGLIYCVPAKLLDELDLLLRKKENDSSDDLRVRLMTESKRIIDPLVWTTDDMPDLGDPDLFEDVIPEGQEAPVLTPGDYDDVGEIEYAISQVNNALYERARHLIREHFKGATDE